MGRGLGLAGLVSYHSQGFSICFEHEPGALLALLCWCSFCLAALWLGLALAVGLVSHIWHSLHLILALGTIILHTFDVWVALTTRRLLFQIQFRLSETQIEHIFNAYG